MLLKQQPNYACPEDGTSNGTNIIKKKMWLDSKTGLEAAGHTLPNYKKINRIL